MPIDGIVGLGFRDLAVKTRPLLDTLEERLSSSAAFGDLRDGGWNMLFPLVAPPLQDMVDFPPGFKGRFPQFGHISYSQFGGVGVY